MPFNAFEQFDDNTMLAVPLSRYARQMSYDECAFWGVTYDGQARAACSDIWTEQERIAIARALSEAQELFEMEIGYPVCPRWIVGTPAEEPTGNLAWVDSQKFRYRQNTRYARLIDFGLRAETVVLNSSLGETFPVDYGQEPAIIGPVDVPDVTDSTELHLFYPGTRRTITPSTVTLINGVAYFSVPRCRLVAADLVDNPTTGYAFDDTANFQTSIEVRRIYSDPTKTATLVRRTCNDCDEETFEGSVVIEDEWLGRIRVTPQQCLAGAVVASSWCKEYNDVRLYYRAGLRTLPAAIETALIRLAHTRLPTPPCGCSRIKDVWKEDRLIPDFLNNARQECPFGFANGAYQAYNVAKQWKSRRMGTI